MFADVVAVTFHAARLSPDGAPSGRMRRRRRTAARRARRTPVRGRDHGAAKRPQRLLPALRQPRPEPAPGLQRGQQFLPQPLGHRPFLHHRARRSGTAVQYQRLPELPCEGRPRPPAGSGRGQRGVDAGTPVDPGRPCGRQDPVAPGGDSRADLRRPVAGRRHSRRRPGRQGAGGLRAAEGEVRGRHRGRTAQADPAYQPARLWADASADDVFRPRRPADDRARPARGDSRRGDPGQCRSGRPQRRRYPRARQPGLGCRAAAHRARPLRLEGRPAEYPAAERARLRQRHGPDQQPAAPRRLQRRPGRVPPGARRRRAGSQRQHLRPGAVLQPQPGGPGAAQGGRPAGAGRQAPVRPGQLRGLPRSRLHYRFRRQRAGAGQPADSSLFRPVAA